MFQELVMAGEYWPQSVHLALDPPKIDIFPNEFFYLFKTGSDCIALVGLDLVV